MDVWTIYSIGDASFLSRVLNAVAAICGTQDFVTACAIALLIGVIIICVQTVIRGQGFPIQTAVICYLFWFICYYPTASVNVHDVYTQQDRKVDNVPLGPAVLGSVISTVGFKVTEMMETAFQMPGASDTLTGAGNGEGGRYANALYFLNNAIRLGANGDTAKVIDDYTGGEFTENLENYVRYCTYRSLQLGRAYGGIDKSEVDSLPVTELLKFDSDMYYTVVKNGGNRADMTCADAWDHIYDSYKAAIDNNTGSTTFNSLKRNLGAINEADPDLAWNEAQQIDLKTKITDALEGLRLDAGAAQDLMLNTMAQDIFRYGMARGHNDYLDRNAAMMVNQAIQQRNMQWATEQTMFFDTMRPIMAFIEGFVYAITPFAAFIMLLGVFGLSLFFKYFLMMVWIQLWMPVVAISNMFILNGATRALSEFANGVNVNSFYGLGQINSAVSTWIAVGGMFAAATPLLTFIIISGSAFAMTSLTGKMSGADHVNERMASPDVVSPAAGLAMQAMHTGNSMSAARTGAEGLIPNLNFSRSAQQQVSDARQEMVQASHAVTAAVNNSVNTSGAIQQALNYAGTRNSQFSNTHSDTIAALDNMTRSMNNQYGTNLSRSEVAAVEAEIGAKISAGHTWSNGSSDSMSASDTMGLDNFKELAARHGWTPEQIDGLSKEFADRNSKSRKNMSPGKIRATDSSSSGWNANVSAEAGANASTGVNVSNTETTSHSQGDGSTVSKAGSLANATSEMVSAAVSYGLQHGQTFGLTGAELESVQEAGADLLQKSRSYSDIASDTSLKGISFTARADVVAAEVARNGGYGEIGHVFDNVLGKVDSSTAKLLNSAVDQKTAYYSDLTTANARDVAILDVLNTSNLSGEAGQLANDGLYNLVSDYTTLGTGNIRRAENTVRVGDSDVGVRSAPVNAGSVIEQSKGLIGQGKTATDGDPGKHAEAFIPDVYEARSTGRTNVENDWSANENAVIDNNRNAVMNGFYNQDTLNSARGTVVGDLDFSSIQQDLLDKKLNGRLESNYIPTAEDRQLMEQWKAYYGTAEGYIEMAKYAISGPDGILQNMKMSESGTGELNKTGQLMADYIAAYKAYSNTGIMGLSTDLHEQIGVKVKELEGEIANNPEINYYLNNADTHNAGNTEMLLDRLRTASHVNDSDNNNILGTIGREADKYYSAHQGSANESVQSSLPLSTVKR